MKNHILIIAHAPLAQALRQCAVHVFPDCAQGVLAFDVAADAAPEASLQAVRSLLAASARAPVLVLTDVLGATPCNIAQQLLAGMSARLIAGVNVPMLLRTVNYRHEALDALVARALAGGTQGISQVTR